MFHEDYIWRLGIFTQAIALTPIFFIYLTFKDYELDY